MKRTKRIPRSIITSSFLAGLTEMYDFVTFGLLATIIHKNYLSNLSKDDSLIITYALFSIGFICRPVGALIFGYIGDTKGRKVALASSVTMMGFASLVMCILPPYEYMGITTCYMIALARIVQGLSLGGEFQGGLVYIIEHAGKKKAGFAGSFVVSGCLSGILLATMVSNIVQLPYLPDWSWRAAFLLGFILSLVGFFIRRKLTETPEFQYAERSKHKIPLIEGLKRCKLEAITVVLIGATTGTNIYFAVVFIPTYLTETIGINLSYLSIITTLILALSSPFFGWVSDHIHRGKLIVVGAILSGLYALIMLPLINLYPTTIGICLVIAIHAAIFGIQDGTINVFGVEIFPTKYRYSCSSFCYSLGMGVIGGLTPMVSSLITQHFENATLILGLYVSVISLLAGFAISLVLMKAGKIKGKQQQTIEELVSIG